MITVTGRENLHTLDAYRSPLGVTCQACQNRAVIPAEKLGAHAGNMKRLIDLKLVCSRCGMRDFEMVIFTAPEQVREFLGPGQAESSF